MYLFSLARQTALADSAESRLGSTHIMPLLVEHGTSNLWKGGDKQLQTTLAPCHIYFQEGQLSATQDT